MMEQAILKTLIYADIFDYPLKAWEIHKWLIGKKVSMSQVEKVLKKGLGFRVQDRGDYYFLKGREKIVGERLKREKQSKVYLRYAKIAALIFKIIPWIKLVGVSGSLAMDNAKKQDDIDLFVITAKKRLWLSRILLLLILDILGKRREKGVEKQKSAGKICINILLEEDSLAQENEDIYLAHEVLQMRVLWQRDGIYQKFLEENFWAFKILPNWSSGNRYELGVMSYASTKQKTYNASRITHHVNSLENLAKWVQLKYMGKPKGKERISDSTLYFHPQDLREKILGEYEKRVKRMI